MAESMLDAWFGEAELSGDTQTVLADNGFTSLKAIKRLTPQILQKHLSKSLSLGQYLLLKGAVETLRGQQLDATTNMGTETVATETLATSEQQRTQTAVTDEPFSNSTELTALDYRKQFQLLNVGSTSGNRDLSGEMDAMADTLKPSCGMCFHIYDHRNHVPKVLLCGHTYCAVCLERWRQGDRISCPEICDKSTKDPIDKLPTNFETLRTIDAMCSNCTNRWTKTCPSCFLNICASCLLLHKPRHQAEVGLDQLQQALDSRRAATQQDVDRCNGQAAAEKLEVEKYIEDIIEELKKQKNSLLNQIDDVIKENNNIKSKLRKHKNSSDISQFVSRAKTDLGDSSVSTLQSIICQCQSYVQILQAESDSVPKSVEFNTLSDLKNMLTNAMKLSINPESAIVSQLPNVDSTQSAGAGLVSQPPTVESIQSAGAGLVSKPRVMWPDYSMATLAQESSKSRTAASADSKRRSMLPPRLAKLAEQKEKEKHQQRGQLVPGDAPPVLPLGPQDILPKIKNWGNAMANNIPSPVPSLQRKESTPPQAVDKSN